MRGIHHVATVDNQNENDNKVHENFWYSCLRIHIGFFSKTNITRGIYNTKQSATILIVRFIF